MRLNCIVLCIFLLTASLLCSQDSAWDWARSAGCSLDNDAGNSIAVDDSGNCYVTGYFMYTATFGTTTLSSNSNSRDIFIAKIDPDGTWLWAKKAGGSGSDYGYSVATDQFGNCFIAGQFSLTATFGTISITSAGDADVFVAKLDTNGNWIWANRGGGTGTDAAYGISVVNYAEGERCYLTGYFNGTATFGAINLTSAGSTDIFAARIDNGTSWTWAVRGGGTGADCANGIATDIAGHSFIAGYFNGTATFGAWTLISAGNKDILVCMLDNAGNWVWATHASATNNDEAWDVATDGNGHCYVTGDFYGTAGFGLTTLTSTSGLDIFIAKLDLSGNWIWAKRGGGSTFDYGYDITADHSGNVYATGEYWAPIDMGPFDLTGIGGRDFYAVKLDTNGNWIWMLEGGSVNNDSPSCICTDNAGNCWLTGSFRGTCYFGDQTVVSNGISDAFIARIDGSPGSGIPIAPQNLRITRYDNDVRLQWDMVNLDTEGQPLIPDAYNIYFNAYLPNSEFFFLDQVDGLTTEYLHFGVLGWTESGFYQIKAVKE